MTIVWDIINSVENRSCQVAKIDLSPKLCVGPNVDHKALCCASDAQRFQNINYLNLINFSHRFVMTPQAPVS